MRTAPRGRATSGILVRPLRLRRGGLVERRALDLARFEDLEDVADLHVVEVLEMEAALEALLDLAGVVLEALERVDHRRIDDSAVPDDAHLRVPADEPVRDHATGDRADPRRAECLAHLGLADRLLRLDGGEHADERLLDVLRQLVDDVVRAYLDTLALRHRSGLGVRADVE